MKPRNFISFLLSTMFLLIAVSVGGAEFRDHHSASGLSLRSDQTAPSNQTAADNCGDPCDVGLGHIGHCSILVAPYASITGSNLIPSLIARAIQMHEAPDLEGLRRPPRLA